MKKCPLCAEEIQEEAIKCKHCGEYLQDGVVNNTRLSAEITKEDGGCGCAIASLIIPGLGQFIRGEHGKGAVYLLLGIGIGSVTAGIGLILIAVISAADAGGAIWKCSNCKSTVNNSALVCKNCGSKFKKIKAIKTVEQEKQPSVLDNYVPGKYVVIILLVIFAIIIIVSYVNLN